MTMIDAMGYFAASLVLATFCAKRMVSLRVLAIASNVAFIGYGLTAQLWPIATLHMIMLPLNIIRLRDALASLGSSTRQEWRHAMAPPARAAIQQQMTATESRVRLT